MKKSLASSVGAPKLPSCIGIMDTSTLNIKKDLMSKGYLRSNAPCLLYSLAMIMLAIQYKHLLLWKQSLKYAMTKKPLTSQLNFHGASVHVYKYVWQVDSFTTYVIDNQQEASPLMSILSITRLSNALDGLHQLY